MNQIERINLMESYLDETQTVLRNLSEALSAYREIHPKLQDLSEYYASEEWRKDFEDDEAGSLPNDLKRGVLSEDGIYNILEDDAELIAEMLSLGTQQQAINLTKSV